MILVKLKRDDDIQLVVEHIVSVREDETARTSICMTNGIEYRSNESPREFLMRIPHD